MAEAIGFIGLGKMGEPFALNLVRAGYVLHVHDTDRAAVARLGAQGVVVHADPAALGSAVETVLLSLPTPAIVEQVVTGPCGLIEGATVRRVIDLSTTGLTMARRIDAALRRRGIALVDAPVSGGVAGARAATVAVMVGCPPDVLAETRAILAVLGRIFHVGLEAGQGQVCKVLNNLLSAAALIITGEVAALGVKAGLDATGMIDVFNAGSGRNSASLDKYPKAILPGTFDMGFSNGLMMKDLDLCMDLAGAMAMPMPAAEIVHREWAAAMAEEGGDADFSTIVRHAERAAAVVVRAAASVRLPAK